MAETIAVKVKRRARMTASSAALWNFDKLGYRFGLLSAADLTLPDFLGIGAQKAGTTWLSANLRCHPQLFLPEKKELHYFNLYFYTRLSRYASRFTAGEGKIKGEVTPAYGILPPQKIRFIKQTMPAVKLILILRNPIDRAWSRAKMVLCGPGTKNIDLNDFSEREIFTALAHRSSQARGEYLEIIDSWMRHFPPRQIHICFYEDLSQRPKEFLEGIFQFLGVRADVDWNKFPSRTVIGGGAKSEIPDRYRGFLEDLYRNRIEALYQRFGTPVQGWRCS